MWEDEIQFECGLNLSLTTITLNDITAQTKDKIHNHTQAAAL
jgi:hypothetical protein